MFPKRKLLRLFKIATLAAILSGLLMNMYIIINHRYSRSDINGEAAPMRLMCQYPKMRPWDPSIAQFFKVHPPLICNAIKNWVEVIDGRFVIQPEAEKKFGKINCNYTTFIRQSDEKTTEGAEQKLENNALLPSDFFRASCISASGLSYTNMQAGIQYQRAIHERLKSAQRPYNGMGLDVVIIGLDSVSRMQFLRKLPKTTKYFTEELDGIIMKGMNIVGDGTPQALIPLLTGKTEQELPNVLKSSGSKLHVDVYPFVWRNFSENGYVTAWSEDAPEVGTFTYRMTGFLKQPTDHYMRIFHNLDDWNRKPKHCIGDRPRVRVVLDWIKSFQKMYKEHPKFAFMFHNELSHGQNDLLQTGDEDVLNFMKELKNEDYLDRTLLILMSDHGARFPEQRGTLQGKQEERNPFLGFAFPKWFQQKYPKAYSNVLKNSERLVTMFDVHKTLLDVVHYKDVGLGSVYDRGISLFKEIPKDRTCPHAGIDAHWCNCLQWSVVNISHSDITRGAHDLVNFINQLTETQRSQCAKLSLDMLIEAVQFQPSPEMLKFKQSKDINGLIPDLSDNMEIHYRIYQIKIRTSPNNGLYEATFRQDISSGTFKFTDDDISRINKYGEDPNCIKQTHEHLRKYCLCKNRL